MTKKLDLEKNSVLTLTIFGIIIAVAMIWNLNAKTGFQNWWNVIFSFTLAGLLIFESQIKYATKKGGTRLVAAYSALILALGSVIIGLISINFIGTSATGSFINAIKTSGNIIGGLGILTFIWLAFRK